jgi:hypothetical protein
MQIPPVAAKYQSFDSCDRTVGYLTLNPEQVNGIFKLTGERFNNLSCLIVNILSVTFRYLSLC